MALSESQPAHAVLPGTNWALWRQVVLQASGFPATGVELMTSPALARAADSLNERERERERDGGDGDGRRLPYEAEFQAETERLTSQILGLAGDERLGLALAWQNHQTLDSAIAPMLRNKASDRIRRDSKQRQHEELIANYWQGYCLKNDTAGFFGLRAPDRGSRSAWREHAADRHWPRRRRGAQRPGIDRGTAAIASKGA